jgi:hypothetical protein
VTATDGSGRAGHDLEDAVLPQRERQPGTVATDAD